jgi:two-component system, NtrC family, response regulator
MKKLTETEIATLVTLIMQRKPLPYEYKEILFDAEEDSEDIRTGRMKSLGELSCISPKMKAVLNHIGKVANKDVPVLIEGEQGTGKKMVARTIHDVSSRNTGPFIMIDCGSLSERDFDVKIFGEESGSSLTNKTAAKGLIELAKGGTIFFNQIGELALPFQAKLMPFFRDKAIQRPNRNTSIRINARIIASSDENLKQLVDDGKFRGDIYSHLNVVFISIPPLRERDEDIFILANGFLDRYSKEDNKKIIRFTHNAYSSILEYQWPGNILELENRVKRAVIMAKGRRITPADLEFKAPKQKDESMGGLKDARETLEKNLIMKTLARYEGNLTRTALELGISRPTLYDLIKRYNITTS